MGDDAQSKSPQPEADFRREMLMLKASQAPVVFFEACSSYGARNGVANITLEGGQHIVLPNGQTAGESRVMAHLRFPIAAIRSLRDALDGIELMLQPAASEEKN